MLRGSRIFEDPSSTARIRSRLGRRTSSSSIRVRAGERDQLMGGGRLGHRRDELVVEEDADVELARFEHVQDLLANLRASVERCIADDAKHVADQSMSNSRLK